MEYVQDGTIEIIFVRIEDNDSDIMTKNLGSLLHARHAEKLVSKKYDTSWGTNVGTCKRFFTSG